ncbi:MAG: hypothetical protein ABIO46_14990 [Chitinophagales bacterium]
MKNKSALIPQWVVRLGVPIIKAVAMISGAPPVFKHESIDALMTGNRNIDASNAKNETGFVPRPFQ